MADLSTWTVEQLRQALNDKETKAQLASALDNTPLTNILPSPPAGVAPGVCIFKPTRQNLLPCSEIATVFYGSKGYCQKHRRTVQSIRDKKEYEESIAASIQPEEPTAPAVSVPNSLEPKVEEVKKVEKVVPPPEVPTKIKKRIQRNKWGRFEDPDTHIVFNPTSKTAYGVQDTSSGKLLPLSKGDVGLCKKYGWPYETIESDDEEEVSDEVEADEAASDEVGNEAASDASDEVAEASDDEDSDVANSSDEEDREADDEGSEGNEADDDDEADDDEEGDEVEDGAEVDDDDEVDEEMCDECGNIVEECTCDVD